MTYDFNGYERGVIRRGSPPDDIARDIAEQDVKPTQASVGVNTKIFDASGEIDLLKVARTIRSNHDNR